MRRWVHLRHLPSLKAGSTWQMNLRARKASTEMHLNLCAWMRKNHVTHLPWRALAFLSDSWIRKDFEDFFTIISKICRQDEVALPWLLTLTVGVTGGFGDFGGKVIRRFYIQYSFWLNQQIHIIEKVFCYLYYITFLNPSSYIAIIGRTRSNIFPYR